MRKSSETRNMSEVISPQTDAGGIQDNTITLGRGEKKLKLGKILTLLEALILIFGIICLLESAFAMEESIQVHGFGGWGYGHIFGGDNPNSYQLGQEDGSYNNSYFALNVSASPYDKFTAGVQTLWRTTDLGLEMDFDYAFAEWAFFDWLRLRIGKVKSPFGIYTEVYDVGTLRPFYSLPQAIYGVPSLVTESFFGGGLTGMYFLSRGWGVQYDLYGGDLNLKEYIDQSPFNPEEYQTLAPKLHDMIGGRVIAHTPFRGLNFGVSIYTGDADFSMDAGPLGTFDIARDRHVVYLVHAEYLADAFSIRAEYEYLQKPSGDADIDLWGTYVEAAYRFWDHWQAAILYDQQLVDIVGLDIPLPASYPTEHREYAVGVNYWFNPNLVLKLAYHFVDGNLYAQPRDLFESLFGDEGIEETTHYLVAGTQFSF